MFEYLIKSNPDAGVTAASKLTREYLKSPDFITLVSFNPLT